MQLCGSLTILWHCLSLELECKLTFSSPVATAEFSKFSGILSAALSQLFSYSNCLEKVLKRHFYLSLLFFGTLHSNGYIFPFLLCFFLLFFSQLFVRPPQTAILLFCISFFLFFFENSTVATKLEKVSFHSNPKEKQ